MGRRMGVGEKKTEDGAYKLVSKYRSFRARLFTRKTTEHNSGEKQIRTVASVPKGISQCWLSAVRQPSATLPPSP